MMPSRSIQYLLAEELHDHPFSAPDPSLPSVEISNGEFAWEIDDIVLHDIDLSVRSGSYQRRARPVDNGIC